MFKVEGNKDEVEVILDLYPKWIVFKFEDKVLYVDHSCRRLLGLYFYTLLALIAQIAATIG